MKFSELFKIDDMVQVAIESSSYYKEIGIMISIRQLDNNVEIAKVKLLNGITLFFCKPTSLKKKNLKAFV